MHSWVLRMNFTPTAIDAKDVAKTTKSLVEGTILCAMNVRAKVISTTITAKAPKTIHEHLTIYIEVRWIINISWDKISKLLSNAVDSD